MDAARSLAGCLALAGVICLTAGPGNAEEITIQQFVVPRDSSAVFTYTCDLIGVFALPDARGAYTTTLIVSETASFPMEVLITGTVDAGWEQGVVITTTHPANDSSYFEVVTYTVTITDTHPGNDLLPNRIYTATVVHLDVDENEDFVVTFTNTVIPEPATAVLLGASALGLLFCRLRRRRAIG